jgi:zinc transport system substrate-binding protein
MMIFILSFAATAGAGAVEKVPVFVSILPQKYFVERIGGDRVDVSVMVTPGASPHIYEPKPQQMVALSKARVYFAIGVEFERVWLEKFSSVNREMRIVHTQEGIAKLPMETHRHRERADERRHDVHSKHKDGERDHQPGIKDPHIWLSPALAMVQARNIVQGLIRVDPDHQTVYGKNYKALIKELVDLDAELFGVFKGAGQKAEFMVFHPAWGYFARAYGLSQVPVEIEGKEPKPAELKRLIQHAKEKEIKVVFVTPQFSTRSAEALAKAIGGQIAFVDPLAEDWAGNMREAAEKFKAAMR